MWIFDTYYKGCVLLWGREKGVARKSAVYPQSFYMHLPDPPAHREMIEALESRFKAEECSFKTIFGALSGHRIFADRKVAEKIEIQTRHQAELYNVDVRQDQRYLAEHNLFPCGDGDESRFSPDFAVPLTSLKMHLDGDPFLPGDISIRRIEIEDGCKRRLEGSEKAVISDLLDLIRAHDPDLILCPHADTWIPAIVRKARRYGLDPTIISRSGFFKTIGERSYYSYGKVNHKEGALILRAGYS